MSRLFECNVFNISNNMASSTSIQSSSSPDDIFQKVRDGRVVPTPFASLLVGRTFRALCANVYDGDTFHAIIDLDGYGQTAYDVTCRAYGYNSAEMRPSKPKRNEHESDEAYRQRADVAVRDEKKKAIEARDFLRTLIDQKECEVYIRELDKYGRALVMISEVIYRGKSQALHNWMISSKHGKPYFGEGEKTF